MKQAVQTIEKSREFFSNTMCRWFFALFVFVALALPGVAQTAVSESPAVKLTSVQFVDNAGRTVEQLIESAQQKRADLLAARQNLATAEARILGAKQRPNPTLEAEYGSARILGGEAESDFSVGVSQVIETGGRRSRRIAVAELELAQARASVLALERSIAANIRQNYARAVAAARQLDVLEKLLVADAELVRVTEARLNEGDAAPLDLNVVRVENDRLRVSIVEGRSELETAVLELKTLAGLDVAEDFKIAPQNERPPRLDLSLAQITDLALRERVDFQAARIGEQLGTAKVNLARAEKVPNVEASVRYSRSNETLDLPESIGGARPDKSNELSFGISVEIPVFNRNRGEIAAATSEQMQAVRQREFLESTIKRDVAVAYRKYRAAAEKLVLYAAQILPRSEENLRSVRAAYGMGEFSVFEVVSEQRRLTENVTGYNNALRDYYTALAELETGIGTTLPATGFAPQTTSVLPDKETVPNQIEREKFLQSLFKKPENEEKK